jgi:D-amino-acid dehydrogenase
MKVLVAGSGIIGVSSAYYLAKAGHEVTVIDREDSAAMGTSHANAGQLSYAMSSPWAAPGVPFMAIKWMFSKYAPLIVNPRLSLKTIKFIFRLLRNCTADRYTINKSRMMRISSFSKMAVAEFIEEHDFDFGLRNNGILQIYRTDKQVEDCKKDTSIYDRYNIKYELLDVEGCIKAEPGLRHSRDKIKGGLRLLEDQSANCFVFVNKLVQECKKLGVNFEYGVEINNIQTLNGNVSCIETRSGNYTADNYVIALGADSPLLLKPLGIFLPIYPVKGYSITLPVKEDIDAPQGSLLDETYKVAITRLGDNVRVAGIAELNGYDKKLSAKGETITTFVINNIFPKATKETTDNEFWTGLRPMTPDGTPVIGKTSYKNLFLNTGHGTLGWTMGLGSGKLISLVISGESTQIDMEGLGVERYQ